MGFTGSVRNASALGEITEIIVSISLSVEVKVHSLHSCAGKHLWLNISI